MEGKKSRYTGYTKAQNIATQKYQEAKLEQVRFWVQKGEKAALQEEARKQGQSMAQYLIQAINQRAERQLLTPSTQD